MAHRIITTRDDSVDPGDLPVIDGPPVQQTEPDADVDIDLDTRFCRVCRQPITDDGCGC